MKAIAMGLIVLFAGIGFSSVSNAEGPGHVCAEGQTWNYKGTPYVCRNGMWATKDVVIIKCKEGRRVSMPVYGKYQGEGELYAMATCRNGKYIFDNPEYNYTPTKGLNKCREGRRWTEGNFRDGPTVDYVCKNGRAVRVP